MDIEEKASTAGGARRNPFRSGLAKTALRASTLTALGLIIALAVLLPNAAVEAQSSTATSTATATATATATPTDYDSDDDGLIDIKTLAQLNAVRHDLNGNGKQGTVSAADWATYTSAFPNPTSGMGCKPTDHDDDATTAPQPACDGYELMMDLDFDTDGDGDVDASDTNSYPNWTPIGTAADPFRSTFKGNLIEGVMPKISNLTISGASTEAGLFGATHADARIEDVGLVNAKLSVRSSSSAKIGALVGSNAGKVIACYSAGESAITATAGAGSYAGGLVGYNTGTVTASFSRATVSMSIYPPADPTVTGSMDIYAGGLIGQNGSRGTVTATYAAGAVKGYGVGGYVGGLVGDNAGTITASYSIAPVTSAASVTGRSAPFVGGLIGHNDGTVTASYWNYIASGVPDDSDNVMPEGKSTVELLAKPPASTSVGGIYEGWNTLTVNGEVAPTTWNFDRLPPMLTYGGHTTELSGSQRFTSSGVDGYGTRGDAGHPREGITLFAGLSVPREYRNGNWIWENSDDGIAWTTLVPISGKSRFTISGAFGTFRFVPNKPEHIGKYIRAKIPLTTGDYLYTRVIGKVKAATNAPAALSFDSGHNPPLVEKAVTVASLPSGAKGLWYRCDANTAKPPSTGCELVGSLDSYTPETVDVDHYLYAHIYYKNSSGAWLRAATGFTPQKVTGVRTSQWRQGR